jgi:hypothetical protein
MKLTTKIHTYTALSFLILGTITPLSAIRETIDAPSAEEVNGVTWSLNHVVDNFVDWRATLVKDGRTWNLRGMRFKAPGEQDHLPPEANAIAPVLGVMQPAGLTVTYDEDNVPAGGHPHLYSIHANFPVDPNSNCRVVGPMRFECDD